VIIDPPANPFTGATLYINPEWQAKALAEPNGSLIANNNTAVWLDRIAAIAPTDGTTMGLAAHLDAALSQHANLITLVIYDLPNRDCNALASNGELTMSPTDVNRYRNEYIAPIVSILSQAKYKSLRIVAIVEPDSLPNLVTNMSVVKCNAASDPVNGYVPLIQYTLNQLYPLRNVYSYLDIGHSGWLGWQDNFAKATTLIANTVKGTTAGVNSVAGFVSNTAGYTPLTEPFLDSLANSALPGSNGGTQVRQAKFYEWNPQFSELGFAQAWRSDMVTKGFPSNIGMLIDTSRNGWGGTSRPTAVSTSAELETFVNDSRVDKRLHRGNWCNQPGGVGERPRASSLPGIHAYVWVKPPGESDGASSLALSYDPNDPAKGFDRFCDPTFTTANGTGTGSLSDAPVAGRWFSKGFQTLLKNAYPPLLAQ
jgi:cellulose 1,4-beta-cellobiosidase